MSVDSQGRILAAGGNGDNVAVVRLTSTGAFDPTFAGDASQYPKPCEPVPARIYAAALPGPSAKSPIVVSAAATPTAHPTTFHLRAKRNGKSMSPGNTLIAAARPIAAPALSSLLDRSNHRQV